MILAGARSKRSFMKKWVACPSDSGASGAVLLGGQDPRGGGGLPHLRSGTVKEKLEHAHDLLRVRLTRRGVAFSGVLPAVLAAGNTAPAALVNVAVRSAVAPSVALTSAESPFWRKE